MRGRAPVAVGKPAAAHELPSPVAIAAAPLLLGTLGKACSRGMFAGRWAAGSRHTVLALGESTFARDRRMPRDPAGRAVPGPAVMGPARRGPAARTEGAVVAAPTRAVPMAGEFSAARDRRTFSGCPVGAVRVGAAPRRGTVTLGAAGTAGAWRPTRPVIDGAGRRIAPAGRIIVKDQRPAVPSPGPVAADSRPSDRLSGGAVPINGVGSMRDLNASAAGSRSPSRLRSPRPEPKARLIAPAGTPSPPARPAPTAPGPRVVPAGSVAGSPPSAALLRWIGWVSRMPARSAAATEGDPTVSGGASVHPDARTEATRRRVENARPGNAPTGVPVSGPAGATGTARPAGACSAGIADGAAGAAGAIEVAEVADAASAAGAAGAEGADGPAARAVDPAGAADPAVAAGAAGGRVVVVGSEVVRRPDRSLGALAGPAGEWVCRAMSRVGCSSTRAGSACGGRPIRPSRGATGNRAAERTRAMTDRRIELPDHPAAATAGAATASP